MSVLRTRSCISVLRTRSCISVLRTRSQARLAPGFFACAFLIGLLTKTRYGKPRHATGNQGTLRETKAGRLRGACAWYVIICRARWNPYKNNGIVVKQPDFSVEYQRVVSTQAQRARRVQPIEKIDVVLYTYNIYVCMCVNTFSKMT